ncbi:MULTISPECIES: LpxI family protein [Megasphaera]|uniref:PF06230 family protein n=1 Tax=Megasphaera vaginalis (ex Srinivasan et al. 2021) TaxID=1111454 RepID=U7UME4_9FIRM|nr:MULTISPECIES: UDP-2,3-diacylglucosamine diphosphatase LpxI [Megasphaera]ERT60505.1 PF06230 family protein [Megasphaera vaginalis (ex Srinivasan et al. 2021)]
MEKLGLLAGIGNLPVEFMRAAQTTGHEVVVIAVVEGTAPELEREANIYYKINVAKLDKIIKTMKGEGVSKVTMIGKVTKEILFRGLKFPDFRAIKLLAALHNRKDDTIMLAIVDELAKDGIEIVDQTAYLKPLLPPVGVLTKRRPTAEEAEDIRFGFAAAKAIGGLDIGQTVVVKQKAVMAVEAIEGTDACIRRGGELGRGRAVVVKVAKPNQDWRFDVPAVGRTTLQSMLESGCTVLAMEAGRTLFVEQEAVLSLANEKGVCICAVDGT